MTHNLSTFFANTGSFSGAGQLSLGPFNIGTVSKIYRMQLRGNMSFQGVTIGTSSVFAGWYVVAVQWVPHGDPMNDVVLTSDYDGFLTRSQVGLSDITATWAPSTDAAGNLAWVAFRDEWRGQGNIGQNADLWFGMKPAGSGSSPNLNVYASMRLWWS